MDITNLGLLFLEGLLSFLSPCILPLVPLYVGYLTQAVKGDEKRQTKIMILTNCFVLGICTVFFIMALGANSIRTVIQSYQAEISVVGGLVLIVFGIINFGLFKNPFAKTLKFEARKHQNPYINAYLIGFFFSFGWTPCVGPYLSNVILKASTTSFLMGNVSILAYALGFVIPFLLLGIFTDLALRLIKNHMNVLKWTTKLGAVVLVVMGIMMTKDGLERIDKKMPATSETGQTPAYNFSLFDQNGVNHHAEDYLGEKTIVQFMTTWCKFCKQSVSVLESYALEHPEYQILLVMAPGSQGEMSKVDMITYINEEKYQLPVLMDETYEMFGYYSISSFPTTFYIDAEGYVLGYTSGLLDKEALNNIMEGLK